MSNNAVVTVNGVPATVNNGAFTASLTLPDGQHQIMATANDQYGQTESRSVTITILTKGTLTGTVVDSGTGQPISSAIVTITDSLSTTLTALSDANGIYSAPNVTQGPFTGTITKVDHSTNSFSGTMIAGQTATVNGSISLQHPVPSAPLAMGITLDSVIIAWSTDQAADSTVEYGITESYEALVSNPALTKNHSIMLAGLDQGTTYHFRVTSANSHGLSTSSADAAFTTAAPPVISGIAVTNLTTDSATISWTTDQPGTSLVEYGTTASYGNSISGPALGTAHSVTLSGLSERTKYHFRITTVNADGIAAQTGDRTFWTRSSSFTATTLNDYGNITVMEVTGSYDADTPEGGINDLPRQEIAKEFFRSHQDDYDFLVVLSNFDFVMPQSESLALYLAVRNDTQGINVQQFDNSSSYGSGGMLQGFIDMGNRANQSIVPGTRAFADTLSAITHELMHRWGVGVKFRAADGTISSALIGRDGSHWSYLFDSDGSVMYGNDWVPKGDGAFTSVSSRSHLSGLDLYLMGMHERSAVAPMTLIMNSNIDPMKMPEPGAIITGTPKTITIDDIIAVEGERIPSAADAQKTFKVGYIFITRPETFTGNELAGIEALRSAWAGQIAALTGGKGSIAGVAPSLTVSITSPADNSTVAGDSVTVTGAIINTSGSETGVTVNGAPATVYGSRFVANNVPLTEGSNTITVTAMDVAGNTATTTASVTAEAAGPIVKLTPSLDSGLSPLTVAFEIDSSVEYTAVQFTVDGNGSLAWDCEVVDQCKATITGDGVYEFTAHVTAADGSVRQGTTAVVVLNRAEMDRLLKAKWEGMKAKLAAQDVEGVVGYFSEATKKKYRSVLETLSVNLPEIAAGMGEIKMDYVVQDVAEYRIARTEPINGIDREITYFIYFAKEADGLWRIESL